MEGAGEPAVEVVVYEALDKLVILAGEGELSPGGFQLQAESHLLSPIVMKNPAKAVLIGNPSYPLHNQQLSTSRSHLLLPSLNPETPPILSARATGSHGFSHLMQRLVTLGELCPQLLMNSSMGTPFFRAW